jgi:hypothetical protein
MEISGDKHNSVLGEEQKHESFGVIQISRSSAGGKGMNLFDSSIRHSHVINLAICRATKYRQHGRDSVHGGEELIEVTMSPTQFADMITNLNNGSGTPVTIQHIAHKQMEPCPVENTVMLHAEEFKEQMKIFARRLTETQKEAKEIATKKMSKKDAQEWMHKIDFLTQEIASNIPFFNKCFAEQMDKTVTEAKGEVEAFVQNRIVDAGMQALFGQKTEDILSIDDNQK